MKLAKILIGLSLLLMSSMSYGQCTVLCNSPCPTYCRNPWVLRVRAVDVSPCTFSEGLSAYGGEIDDINTVVVPEVDLSFFFYENLAVEMSLATSRHGVNVSGTGNISSLGKVSLLMPIATLQYHFCPDSTINPYVGVGVNYTFYYNVDKGLQDCVHYRDAPGFVAQVGIDLIFCKHFIINFDVKKSYMESRVKIISDDIVDDACVRINPWTFGVGVGFRF